MLVPNKEVQLCPQNVQSLLCYWQRVKQSIERWCGLWKAQGSFVGSGHEPSSGGIWLLSELSGRANFVQTAAVPSLPSVLRAPLKEGAEKILCDENSTT